MNDIIPVILLVLVIIFVLFLIGRELVCWYWKINESLAVLKEIRDLLAAQQKTPHRPITATEREANASAKALRGLDAAELERQALSADNTDTN